MPKALLDDDLVERIIGISQTGTDFIDSCLAAGVGASTARRWKAEAEEAIARRDEGQRIQGNQDLLQIKVYEGVQEAHAKGKAAVLAVLRRASQDNYQVAEWLAERVYGVAAPSRTRKKDESERGPGRPIGAVSAPDRKGAQVSQPPPRLRLASE